MGRRATLLIHQGPPPTFPIYIYYSFFFPREMFKFLDNEQIIFGNAELYENSYNDTKFGKR